MSEIKVVYFRDGKPQTEFLEGVKVGYKYDDPDLPQGLVKLWANGPTGERTLILNSEEVTAIDMTIKD